MTHPGASSRPLDYVRTLFDETQGLRVWWVWLIAVGVPLVPLAVVVHGYATGRAPLSAMLIAGAGCCLPALLCGVMKLRVTVTCERISLVLWPIRRAILIDQIASAEACTYSFWEFGGWGLRYSLRDSTTAYTMSGYDGVRIVTTKGKKLLIGSQKPAELERSIRQAMDAARDTPPSSATP